MNCWAGELLDLPGRTPRHSMTVLALLTPLMSLLRERNLGTGIFNVEFALGPETRL